MGWLSSGGCSYRLLPPIVVSLYVVTPVTDTVGAELCSWGTADPASAVVVEDKVRLFSRRYSASSISGNSLISGSAAAISAALWRQYGIQCHANGGAIILAKWANHVFSVIHRAPNEKTELGCLRPEIRTESPVGLGPFFVYWLAPSLGFNRCARPTSVMRYFTQAHPQTTRSMSP